MDNLENIVPARSLNLTCIVLDSVFIVVFLTLLMWKKRYMTLCFSLLGGIVYFLVDYVIFYHIMGSRVLLINGVNAQEWQYFLYLFWHELSSGITNFGLIWLCLSKDKYLKEWLVLVIGWWFVAPAIATLGGEATIETYRTTSNYHAAMGIICVLAYLGIIIYNLTRKENWPKANILKLLLIGVGIQAAWEGAFLLYGIRPWGDSALTTWIIDSLIETNLGMPFFFFIVYFAKKWRNEDLSKVHKAEEELLQESI